MKLSEIEPGMKVVCKEAHTDGEGGPWWNSSMNNTVGIKLTVEKITRENYVKCTFDNPDGSRNWWCYNASWLEPYTGKVEGPKPMLGIRQICENPEKGYTTVIFDDNTKVVVKVGQNVERPDIYSAVTAAIAIRVMGSNSALKREIATKLTKKKTRGDRRKFTIEAGDIVKVTRKGKEFLTSPEFEGGYKGLDVDAELLVTEVDAVCAYVNVASKVKEIEYRVPVDRLYIVRKGN